MTIRVYIVEDHPVMREALVEFLALGEGLEVCGSAASAEQAMEELAAAEPSLLLLDLSLPGRSGLDMLIELRRTTSLPCLILSGHAERSHIKRAFAAGANGYLVKGRPAELMMAIREVARGGTYHADGRS